MWRDCRATDAIGGLFLLGVIGGTSTIGCGPEAPGVEGGESAPTEERASILDGAPENDKERLIYFLGVAMGRSFALYHLTDEEEAVALRGLQDTLSGKRAVEDADPFLPQIQQLAESRKQELAQVEGGPARAFLEEAAASPGAEVSEAGFVYVPVEEGVGRRPQPGATVRVHYHGTLRDGTVFDSSVDRGIPAEFNLYQVIRCWTLGVLKMRVGEKALLYCPPSLAYGATGSKGIPGGAALKFEIELLEIVGKQLLAPPEAQMKPDAATPDAEPEEPDAADAGRAAGREPYPRT